MRRRHYHRWKIRRVVYLAGKSYRLHADRFECRCGFLYEQLVMFP